jgi:hypothetical protein
VYTPDDASRDCVTCIKCDVRLSAWQGVKDPLAVHAIVSPLCGAMCHDFPKTWVGRMGDSQAGGGVREGGGGGGAGDDDDDPVAPVVHAPVVHAVVERTEKKSGAGGVGAGLREEGVGAVFVAGCRGTNRDTPPPPPQPTNRDRPPPPPHPAPPPAPAPRTNGEDSELQGHRSGEMVGGGLEVSCSLSHCESLLESSRNLARKLAAVSAGGNFQKSASFSPECCYI